MLGFLTQLAAGVSVLAGAAVYLYHPAWVSSFLNLPSPDTIGVALAIALMGPGAISLDAYFFGRRTIVIPSVASHPLHSCVKLGLASSNQRTRISESDIR